MASCHAGLVRFFLTLFKYRGWNVTNLQGDVVVSRGVKSIGGLTCDFWAEKRERKIQVKAKTTDSAVSRVSSAK
jgi:hypothetical protein